MQTSQAVPALQAALAGLFPHGVAVAAVVIADNDEPAHPDEAAAVARAVPSRQAEFAAGRAAARQALRLLGQAAAAIPAGPNRQPLWPPGISGSISHSAGIAVAALRRGAPLGLDVEPDEGLDPDLWPVICGPEELDALPIPDRGHYVRQVFSAKEAAYKAQYPLTHTLIGFDAMTVRLSETGFSARFCRPVGGFAAGQDIQGRLLRSQGLIFTGVAF
jgi:4'-phosphopantetheinyl transferase EntD